MVEEVVKEENNDVSKETTEVKEEEKKENIVRYKRKSEPIKVEFEVGELDGNVIVLDVGSSEYPDMVKSSEYYTFIKPWFSLHQFIKSMSITSNQLLGVTLNTPVLENLRLQYLVKECSLLNIELQVDVNGYQSIANIEDLVGENGLDEAVLGYMVSKMYEHLRT